MPNEKQEPAAWAVWSRQSGCLATSVRREDAVDMQSEFEVYTDIVPLYLSPPLTGEEREAVAKAAATCSAIRLNWTVPRTATLEATSTVLRSLLEKHK